MNLGPMLYDNSFKYSEAEKTLVSPRDWAKHGIAIGLGTPGNTSTPGGSGTLFIDDIRLYKPAPQEPPAN